MGEVTLSINGKTFGISCDDGQEDRLLSLSKYIDSRLRELASAGSASSEAHLLVLTNLVLADEIFDLKDRLAQTDIPSENAGHLKRDELAIIQAIDHLTNRIESISKKVQAG